MTRTVTTVGLIAMFLLGAGSLGFSITPAGAEMMEADMSMMKATALDLMALKAEIATLQAEFQRLGARAGSMSKMIDKAASDYCASVPDALLATGFAPGLCK
ncbi:MAG: hypothetical protein ACREJ6_01415 [Candidatus Methylomirabilis sp.]